MRFSVASRRSVRPRDGGLAAFLGALAVVTLLDAPARAESPAVVPPAANVSSARRHDGLYVRIALGAGPSLASGSVEGFDAEFDVKGIAFASELAVGGSPVPGLAIGAGAYVASLFAPTYDTPVGDFDGGFGQLAVFGPFVDVYPLPERGFHVELAPGLAVASAGEGDCPAPPCFPPETYTGTGVGFMAGAGYDFWIDDEWSLGALARVLYASTTLGSGSSGLGAEADVTLIFPSLLATATFH